MNETLLEKLKSKEYTDQVFADKQDELKEILRILEDENAGPDARRKAYRDIGNLFYDLGRYEEAEQAAQKDIDLEPNDPAAYYNLGISLYKLGRNEDAEQAWKKAIEIKPNYAEAYNYLGFLLSNLGRREEAEQAWKNTIKIKPDDAVTHYNLGVLLEKLGRNEEAEKAWEKAIELKPDLSVVYIVRGNLFLKLGQHEEAEQAYKKAIELEPDYAMAYYNLGKLLKRLDRNEEAENITQKAFRIKKIRTFHLENFTVFRKADFEFCPGINVLIGTNGTGKTHVMKSIYTLLKLEVLQFPNPEFVQFPNLGFFQHIKNISADHTLGEIFRIMDIGSLVHFQKPDHSARAVVFKNDKNKSEIEIHNKNNAPVVQAALTRDVVPPFCFIPSQEFLSINEGFIATYQNRELPYDLTYYDLSVALNALPLRREKLTGVQHILDYLVRLITGQNAESKELLSNENGRFYFNLPEGRLDVHLVADGYRKLATLYYLLRNGSLTKGGTLFWDEPEANLNPKLIVETVRVLKMLAEAGMQIFLATHDYLLSYELSLMAEYPDKDSVDIKFFALHKPDRASGVQVESGKTLAEIENNPILQEFAAHYDRESELFHRSGDEEE